jgi:hypothetical protein
VALGDLRPFPVDGRPGVSTLGFNLIAVADLIVRRHMVEKFGPVRTVKPDLVFELAFARNPAIDPPQVRHRRPLPENPPLAGRQEARRGRLVGDRPGFAPGRSLKRAHDQDEEM